MAGIHAPASGAARERGTSLHAKRHRGLETSQALARHSWCFLIPSRLPGAGGCRDAALADPSWLEIYRDAFPIESRRRGIAALKKEIARQCGDCRRRQRQSKEVTPSWQSTRPVRRGSMKNLAEGAPRSGYPSFVRPGDGLAVAALADRVAPPSLAPSALKLNQRFPSARVVTQQRASRAPTADHATTPSMGGNSLITRCFWRDRIVRTKLQCRPVLHLQDHSPRLRHPSITHHGGQQRR